MEQKMSLGDDAEIKKALSEFEMSADSGKTQREIDLEAIRSKIKGDSDTEGVELGIDKYKAMKFYNEAKPPKIIKLVMKCSGGLIKKESGAVFAILVFVVVVMAISFYIFYNAITPPRPSPEILEQIRQMSIDQTQSS